MIELNANLTGDMAGALDKFEKDMREKVVLSGVAAMGRVIYDEVKLNTSGARAGGKPLDPPGVKTGTLHSAVYRIYLSDRSRLEGVQIYRVSVNKSRAPHWHLIEFGTSRAPAHPYIRPAADKMGDAIKAGLARMEQRIEEIGAQP